MDEFDTIQYHFACSRPKLMENDGKTKILGNFEKFQ